MSVTLASYATTENNGWRLLYNPPVVSTFSGAATYQYTFDLPPARHDLQPALQLSYNSRRVDGVLGWWESGWVGAGWSVDLVDILREGVKYCWPDNTEWICYANRFTLLLNGTGYELEPAAGVTAGKPGRYYARNAPQLYVELRDDSPPDDEGGNKTGLYWLVRTPDGTEYRLGYTTNSEQVLCRTPNGEDWYGGGYDAGRAQNFATYRWRVDSVRDVYGNRMEVTYREAHGGVGNKRDTASVLSEIRYNCRTGEKCATRIVFVGTAFEEQPGDEPIFGPQGELRRIEIYHTGRRVRSYLFQYQSSPNHAATRRLTSIQEVSGDGELAFPATTFGYRDFPNKEWCPDDWDCPHDDYHRERFPYPRLIWAENGYGARIEFTYESDGRADWSMPYNYRVAEMRTYDGVHADPVRVSYTYGTRCYDQSSGGDYYTNGGVLCRGRNPVNIGPLVGHDVVTETIEGYEASTPLMQQTHRFYIDDHHSWRLGLEYRTEQYSPDGTLMAQTEREWSEAASGTASWAQLRAVVETLGTDTARTEYRYDAYGNVIREARLGNVSKEGDESIILRGFIPNEQAWLVDLPSWEQVSGRSQTILRETHYLYDGQSWGMTPTVGSLTAVVVGAGDLWITTTYEYDTYGHQTAMTDPLGRVTRTAYDSRYHLYPVRTTNPLGWTTLTQWNEALGTPEVVTAANGAVTTYAYDGLGRLTGVTYPDPETGERGAEADLLYTYPTPSDGAVAAPFAIGQARRSSGGYHHTWTLYDGLGRSVQTQEEAGNGLLVVTHQTYDGLGRVRRTSLPMTATIAGGTYITPAWEHIPYTLKDYDALGRLIEERGADGAITRWAYSGWRTLHLDPNGHQVIQEKDGLGRLVRVQECRGTWSTPNWGAGGPETLYSHDGAGNLTGVRDAEGNVTRIAYDPLGRKVEMWDPSMGHWTYGYDAAGNLVQQTDGRGVTLRFTYDALNRLEQKAVDGGPVLATYGYDEGRWGLGRRTRMTDGTGRTTWAYDARGRVVTETRALTDGLGTYVTGWTYDAADRVVAIRYPGGEIVHNTYDLRGLLTGVTGEIGEALWAYLAEAAYNAAGQVVHERWGNGLETSYTYREDNLRLTRLHLSGAGGALLDFRYGYDPAGNIAVLTDTTRTETTLFGYDERDRLTSAAGPYEEAYAYSEMGNLLTRTVETEARAYTYGERSAITPTVPGMQRRLFLPLVMAPPAYPTAFAPTTGQPFAVQALSDGSRFAYDGNGNMILRVIVSGTQVTTYTQHFDAENRLTVVTETTSGFVTRFGYDGDGRRIWRSDGVTTTLYLGEQVEVSIGPGGRITRTYYYAGSRPIAVRVREAGHSRLYYLHSDHLGSVVLATYGQVVSMNLRLYLPLILRGSAAGRAAAGQEAKAPQPGLSPLTLASPLAPPEGEPPGVEKEAAEALPSPLSSPLPPPPPEPGEAVPGSETRYRPYGEVRTPGEPVTALTERTFTGQSLDSRTGLMDYRARWYDPRLGRFIQPDTVVPGAGNPQALNRYAYVVNNPLRYTDLTGHIANDPNELNRADEILRVLHNEYNVTIDKDWGMLGIGSIWNPGSWRLAELETVLKGVQDLAQLMGRAEQFRNNLGGVRIMRQAMKNTPGRAMTHKVWLRSIGSGGFSGQWEGVWTVVHELAHAWDAVNDWQLSKELGEYTGGRTTRRGYNHGGIPPKGADDHFTRKEDWAESVAAFIYPHTAQAFIQNFYPNALDFQYNNYYALSRAAFVAQQVNMEPQYLLFLQGNRW